MGGLNFEDNFGESLEDIGKYIGTLQDKIENEKAVKTMLKDIGVHIKKVVKNFAPKKSANPSYSDFNESEYKHVVDDITYKVKKSQATGKYYVSIKGGKKTGYKWLWINDGHVMKNGQFVRGNHFVDKAEEAAEEGVNQIIDSFIKEVLEKND